MSQPNDFAAFNKYDESTPPEKATANFGFSAKNVFNSMVMLLNRHDQARGR
jgi:hypothetical protein